MNFFDAIRARALKAKTLLSVGLDPDMDKIPIIFKKSITPLFDFNKKIIDATHEHTLCYKIQFAHYAASGRNREILQTIEYIKSNYPSIKTILDYKRGDIGNTAINYAEEAFSYYSADSVTYSPYMGFDSVEPLIKYEDKGVFLLCKTSNPGSKDFQDLLVSEGNQPPEPLYLTVAKTVQNSWNKNKNVALVVGGTHPHIIKQIRDSQISLPFLVPGIGAQGGDLKEVLANGAVGDWTSLIISSSRGIIHKSSNENDFETLAKSQAKLISDACSSLL